MYQAHAIRRTDYDSLIMVPYHSAYPSRLVLPHFVRQMAAIRWLLDQGADPRHVDKAGYTPLAWACRSGVFPAVVALVDAGGDVMQRRPALPGGT